MFGRQTPTFQPETDIPPLDGKVIIVTGGNMGLGKQSVLELSRHRPAQIWLAARNLDKARAAMEEIREEIADAPIRLLELDLSSFESVKRAAATFSAESARLDILMLNAGVMAIDPGLTKDGYEIQFGTNNIGHALLTKLLLPILQKTAESSDSSDVRIVSLTSQSHNYAPTGGIQFDKLKTSGESLGAYPRYAQTKLANILWVRQMAKLYPQFTVAAIHPGVVPTGLVKRATSMPTLMRMAINAAHGLGITSTVENGVRNQLWACVSKDVKSGEYYEPVGVGGLVSKYGKDNHLAEELWDWLENELGQAELS
ncbi:hypothetical protein LTR10_017498 [Elasticomyces elasticus]|uniref:Short-chain dehydrogenase/reductase n=1 Tax=Exophiala sideris TaxID=1016849 RepID=A0ABR0IZT9_9EURO|nr:hypothetical protein LTR10_017498 [Elasticomyces elasticus]KAK5023496.1 hypothetical protein LTS07_009371 [Exophiala sideris]KAK5028128.1 hypothetical protein LTR13_009116 [Exophiala sideris]KAK5052786.1 hypothetical protein LTR69_009612 [Exophiala sideris]KAK5178397.1 hypothetical protein LTR44_009022 [Eurotiomycetes sp. CCFEE 6388]